MILLDTHAFYWYMCDKDRLTPAIVNRIEVEDCVCISIATFWEMTIITTDHTIPQNPVKTLWE